MTEDILDVALAVASALEAVGVPYYIGGSVASSLQATARTTQDVDFVVEMRPHHAAALSRALGPDFAVDEEALRDAVARGWSWNVFHLPTGIKIDLIMREDTAYDREAFSRRRRLRVDVDTEPFVKSVEDSILKKLQWFRDGGGQSSTQWRDVVELLRVNGPHLDAAYLDLWAPRIGVADLLERARAEAAA